MKSRIITLRSVIESVPSRWREQYPNVRKGNDKFEIYERLKTLDLKNASHFEVDSIIGNDTWTHFRCAECEEFKQEDYLQVGDEPDYESNTVNVCFGCLEQLVLMIAPTRK